METHQQATSLRISTMPLLLSGMATVAQKRRRRALAGATISATVDLECVLSLLMNGKSRRILHALLEYKDDAGWEIRRWELNYRRLPEEHRWDVPLSCHGKDNLSCSPPPNPWS